MIRYSFFFVFVFFLSAFCAEAGELRPLRLWIFIRANFSVDKDVESNIELVRRAAKAGYNGVLLVDGTKFCRWDKVPQRFFGNLKKFREECRRQNMELFVGVCPMGYSNGLLSRNPNLAEGMPVIDAPFIVQNGRIVPEMPVEPILKNGGFEDGHRNHTPIGWKFVDNPGTVSIVDTETAAEGKCSLRMRDIGPDEPRNGRVAQQIAVKPFHYYHISVQVKTDDFDSTAEMNIGVHGKGEKSLNRHMPPIAPTQDWTRIDVTFNSLDNDSVVVSFGTWGGRRGTVRWDDARIEPAGLVNLVRRAGAPIQVKSEDGRTIYTEGKDFEPLVDPLMGNDPHAGTYTAWHKMPVINIPAGSRLNEGQRVLISYYHTSIIYAYQVACCMAEPETREILQWQIEQVCKHVQPDGYFMTNDEIRQGGWDKSCVDTGKTPGELLADNVTFCVETILKADPGKQIAVWSDMFDPHHNAKKDGIYYLVKGQGPWYGSWKGLPKDVIVGNWNKTPAVRKDSLKHFDDLGNPQVLAGYYDAEPVEGRIQDWLRDAADCRSVQGAMYTTWKNKYDNLERFAEAVKKQWAMDAKRE